ncbi:putative DEAD/H helicase [Synechococcus sp. BL107]|uniref:DEAD/DEAH box helicase n=1 Tax=Synechococcus sp. BL107 TaxID=313625 RepID=UPI0000E546CD|nr:helicase-related protein [Synechococcus sp. BL107]EAU70807.1 putative DEAD/H helicase [Synechococcus sp. BL107]
MAGLADHTWRGRFSSSLESLLEGFYKPALMDAVRYWRVTGYFTSRSLLQVLEGVENLVAASPDGLGRGQMRLITGVFLSEADITALAAGTPSETVLTDHLSTHFPFEGVEPGGQGDAALGAELLAWLVSRGHLEIRVGLPLIDGHIVNDGAIFHAKEGVIEDKHGQRLGFSGSVNETPNGWTSNFETIQTFCSWKPGGVEAIDDLEAGFLRLWQNQDAGARTFTLPEAIRQQLAIYAPSEQALPRRLKPFLNDLPAPEPEPVVEIVPDIDERRRIVWSYVLQAAASDLPGAERVGEGTSAVTPWPHQQRAFQRLWQQWPPRLLIADEVGLGKTVQAGLLLRQAWLSGRARRMLVMAPASVLKQWQRELREKFGLDWPIYSGKSLDWQPTRFRPDGLSRPVDRSSWTAEPYVLVSSHLMRRRDRHKDLLEAEPYDLVVLDEAHHARTRRENSSSGGERLRPNTLMQLMQQLSQRTNGLLLLTATPMQVSELEVWDLLALLGMPPEWTEDAFERFFEWVEKENPDEATLAYLAGLWRSSVSAFGEAPDNAMPEELRRTPLRKRKALRALNDRDPLSRRNLSVEIRQASLALAKRWTPVQGLISRHSRNLLRAYKQQGSMDLAIGTRHVDDRFLESTPQERALYDAVEGFISSQYAQATGQKKSAVGFVMTIYRRRLASSVAALVSTLEKRLAGQQQQLEEDAAAAEDDDISDEQSFDLEGMQSAFQEPSLQGELEAIGVLLDQAKPLVGHDSKGAEFLKAIEQMQDQGYKQVIVFSQYTDTVDALKELLISAERTSLMAFTGRGGEILQKGGVWKALNREATKRGFKEGNAEILLCTDAAAEGLNFQFCGALINYDMPWNPMRVEQRIGRIDRIGQTHEQMQIVNLHLDGTVEADVYRALKGRIAMFEQVVGKLQPILAKASSSISQATLVGRDQREKARASAVAAVEQESEIKGLDLDDVLQDLDAIHEVVNSLQPSPLTLADLEAILRQPSLLPPGCSSRPIGAYDFAWTQPGLDEEMRVTCNASYYEDNSDSCELWVPGSPLFPTKAMEELATGETSMSREEFLQTISAASNHST